MSFFPAQVITFTTATNKNEGEIMYKMLKIYSVHRLFLTNSWKTNKNESNLKKVIGIEFGLDGDEARFNLLSEGHTQVRSTKKQLAYFL